MPKFKVTLDMVEYSSVEVEVEAASEESAENKALKEAKKRYYTANELPWETYVKETKVNVEDVEEIEEVAAPKRTARTKRAKPKADAKPKVQRVAAKVLSMHEYRALGTGRR